MNINKLVHITRLPEYLNWPQRTKTCNITIIMGSLKNARSMGYVKPCVDHCFEISMTLNLFLIMATVMCMVLSSVLKFDSISSSQGAGSCHPAQWRAEAKHTVDENTLAFLQKVVIVAILMGREASQNKLPSDFLCSTFIVERQDKLLSHSNSVNEASVLETVTKYFSLLGFM